MRGHPIRMTFVLACLLVACALPGCSDDDPVEPGDTTPVMALDVGNTWHYVRQQNEPGAPMIAFSRSITEHREIIHDGRTLLVAVESPLPDDPGKALPLGIRLLRNEADGLYSYGTIDGEEIVVSEDPELVAPRHGRPGTVYVVEGGMSMVCEAADSLVVTDFGEAVADVYMYSLDEGTVLVPDVFVVPGVGLTRYYIRETSVWMVGYEFD